MVGGGLKEEAVALAILVRAISDAAVDLLKNAPKSVNVILTLGQAEALGVVAIALIRDS